jgi:thiol-disulfide isomerase/thioredoxin
MAMGADEALIPEVRALLRAGKRAEAVRVLAAAKAQGVTPRYLEAHSWVARDALAKGELEVAFETAARVHDEALAYLKVHKLDEEKNTPIALGAAIEVKSQVLARKKQTSEAVALLNESLRLYGATSIKTRLYKNLNLITLAGKVAMPLGLRTNLGPKAMPLSSYRGRPVVMMFWAHWCGDCKAQAPLLGELQKSHPEMVLLGPTQTYGYVAGGEDAAPAVELPYIDKVRKEFYEPFVKMPVTVDAPTFQRYGSSTTPTLVFVDKRGVVRQYHPGRMTREELEAAYAKVR